MKKHKLKSEDGKSLELSYATGENVNWYTFEKLFGSF